MNATLSIASLDTAHLDQLTCRHTAFTSFQDMLDAKGGYSPSFYIRRKTLEAQEEIRALADQYDRAQEERGDVRRAYRGDFGGLKDSSVNCWGHGIPA